MPPDPSLPRPSGRGSETPYDDLLLEIGCEEIPAKMLARAIAELPGKLGTLLGTERLEHRDVRAYGTPRRAEPTCRRPARRRGPSPSGRPRRRSDPRRGSPRPAVYGQQPIREPYLSPE